MAAPDTAALQRYQLTVRCQDLPHRFGMWSPTSFAIIEVIDGPFKGKQLGKTESVEYTPNPSYCHIFLLETNVATFMPLRVTVYQDAGVGRDSDKVLAKAEFEATEVYEAPGHEKSKKAGGSKIFVSMEQSQKGGETGHMKLQFRGLDIKNMEPGWLGLGRSDPFFELAKKHADPSVGYVRWTVVYRSEVIRNHLNPYWEAFTISLEQLCYCDMDCPLQITVYDYDKGTTHHKRVGTLETTASKLRERISIRGNADRERAFPLFTTQSESARGRMNQKEDDNLRHHHGDNQQDEYGKRNNRGLIVVLQAEILDNDEANAQGYVTSANSNEFVTEVCLSL